MLTGFKVSSLALKFVFYRLKLIGKGGSYGIEILCSLNAKMKYINK